MIDTTKDIRRDYLSKELLETNGIGGYCSMSISGGNTRKYHGLLVAAKNPPTERRVLVPKIEERIKLGGNYFDLSVNEYPEVIHPTGYQYLNSFERRPVATWSYKGTNWAVDKKVFMVQGSNTTVLIYENKGTTTIDLELHPLFSDKDYHGNFHQNDFDFYAESSDSKIKIHPYYGSPAIYWKWSKGTFEERRDWYKNIQLFRENYRGLEDTEDYYHLGSTLTSLKPGASMYVIFSTEEKMMKKNGHKLLEESLAHFQSQNPLKIKDQFYHDLLASGNQFLVNRQSTKSKTIIAGYHWFTDWGRDTMIAMRGLTIATGDQESSKSILSTFFKNLDEGMLPNRFPDYDGQEVEYNTIDATLWLFITLYEYYQKFEDEAFIKKHIKKLESILEFHTKGTRYNIKVNEQGFIYGGMKGWQLTWMDAKVGDFVVTPRIGCPIEITVLWYNALKIFETFAEKLNYTSSFDTTSTIKLIEKNFKKYYWNDQDYLNDVVIPKIATNEDFRCNQIYAVSLPFTLLTKSQQKKIVNQVGLKLKTDYGLRSLEVAHPDFEEKYGGDQWSRDTAYHQGTVWTFLTSEYYEAYLKVNQYSEKSKRQVKEWLEPLRQHFYNSDCVHGVSEIFDGLEPKDGRGCIQQAWSVAAIIKLYAEHQLYKIKSK